jgi:3-oxoisoapionate decarboxylase
LERRYERFASRVEWERWRASAVATLQRVEPILARHGVQLAVENHKDWNAPEQAEVFRRLSSEWIGICLDFGNNLALLEDPVEVAETLAPWILTTHVKDMALRTAPDGFLLSEVPLGKGILDLPALVKICRAANPRVRFLLEMITRDPLPIPCLTERYRATFTDFQDHALQRTMDLARRGEEASVELPYDSDQTDAEALDLEEGLIRESLDWWLLVHSY